MVDTKKNIWIFGYGSLMWKPEFLYSDIQPALLRGYHRSLCVYSIEYRGTFKSPGLVLGLDNGGSCKGLAMRVEQGNAKDVIEYLHNREMKHQAYRPKWLTISIPKKKVKAYCFVVNRNHTQYTGKLNEQKMLELILEGNGKGGSCLNYLQNTIRELDKLGIKNGPLHRIARLAKKFEPTI